MENPDDFFSSLLPYLIEHGLSLLGAIAILVTGWAIASWAGIKVRNITLNMQQVDNTLVPVLAKITRLAIIIITILAVLNQFGVQTTSIIAVLGAATLAIGLALQGTLSNVAAGVMLLTFRPFKIDDFISVGELSGTVTEIGIFTSKMKTIDGLAVFVPNSNIWGNEITNFSKNDTRRIDLIFGISYTDDMDKAISLIETVFDTDERILKDPEPVIAVHELGDSSVNIIARPWVKREDYWAARWDIIKKTKKSFDKNSISIPFPQRDVHLYQVKN